jgi:cytoskeletal protein CcmA (bactofilin family)
LKRRKLLPVSRPIDLPLEKLAMLFNKKNTEDPMPTMPAMQRKLDDAPTRSIIDPGLKITGNIEGDGGLQIDGHISGDIHCAHVVVGKAATVAGNITAEEVVVRGKVEGVIRGNRVILQEGAQVHSEIFHKRLTIEEGALFEGNIRMRNDPLDELLVVAAEMKAADNKAQCSAENNRATQAPLIEAEDGETPMATNGQAPLAAQPEIASEVTAPTDTEMQRIPARLRERRRTAQ